MGVVNHHRLNLLCATIHPESITDHVVKENHVMDWESARIVIKESD